ncbi:MAG TPA: hypothetical protein VNT53_10125 [Pseudolysinimonas sp.]|nr:hypothetical protein [Pseudolysinimonas sp.]
MSWFTIGEIFVWMLVAALIGAVVGWLLHSLVSAQTAARRRRAAVPHPPGTPGEEPNENSSLV